MGKRESVQLAVKTTHKIREKLNFPLLAQPKLNGVRGLIKYDFVTKDNDLFKQKKQVIIESSEGNRYVLPHLEKILLPVFEKYPDIILDGELYIHKEPLNRIIRRLPKTNANGTISKPSLPSEDLEFHIFDIKNNEIQSLRLDKLKHISTLVLLEHKISIVPTQIVYNLIGAEIFLEECIKNDYEGIILRYPDSLYSAGSKRIKVMLKWKKAIDTECEIIDLINEGWKDNVYVIKFLLKNDINNETFLCNVGDDDRNAGEWSNSYKQSISGNYAIDKTTLKGKKATVKFYERSGVKKVPFHANVVAIRDYE